jgi:hypothetical protein
MKGRKTYIRSEKKTAQFTSTEQLTKDYAVCGNNVDCCLLDFDTVQSNGW